MLIFDTIIIGAGVSGITASIYLKRANKKILLLEKSMIGGQINKTSIIENYPGFIKIDGPTLTNNLLEQIKSLDIDYKIETVTDIKKENDLFLIKTNKDAYKSKTIIISTGRIPRHLNLSNEEKLIGNGVSYCAYCDGFFFKNKEVMVVGGGNSAVEESLYLSEICSKVYIIHRKDSFTADEILVDKLKKKGNIFIKYNSTIKALNETDNRLSSVTILCDNYEEKIDVSGLFIYIGNIPKVDFIKSIDIKTENNYIIVNNDLETNIKGIYACGDIIKKKAYQISTAVGEGALAAINIINDLKK